MNPSVRAEVSRERDHAQEHRGDPAAATMREELRPDLQAPPRDPVGPHAPDKGGAQTFAGGAGI
jgi:hypothetical protein